MPSNESDIAVMKSDINYIKDDIKEIKDAVKTITNELPKKADRSELDCKADKSDVNNISKANGLQRIFTNILVGAVTTILATLITYWIMTRK